MGLDEEREKPDFDPTEKVRDVLLQISNLYKEAHQAIVDAEADEMHRKLRRAINLLRPLYKFLKVMEINSDWIRDFVDGRPSPSYVNVEHKVSHEFLDIIGETESCPAHVIPCGEDGKHNDGKAIEFFLREGCEPCSELITQAIERMRDGKTVENV